MANVIVDQMISFRSFSSFITQPTVTPLTGGAGQVFTATPGTTTGLPISNREWRLNGSIVSTSLSYTATTSGTLTYQEFAGAVSSNQITAIVTAASLGPFLGSTTQTWGDNSSLVFGKVS